MWIYVLFVVPAVLALLALRTDWLAFKVGVPAACAAILIIHGLSRSDIGWSLAWVIVALGFSMIGDAFLSNKGNSERYFVIGIGAYLLAHVGYLLFALLNGGLNWPVLGVLLTGYLVYYVLALRVAIDSPLLSVSALAYLVVSCVALAAAFGLRLAPATRALYVIGIVLIVLSDTFISFNEFLRYRAFNKLILPTYYMAHTSITLSILLLAR